MSILYRLLHQDPESREGIITVTSALGILVNLFVAVSKVIFGALASSIAIISEGVNNAADALTSILTLVGTRLAGKHPDEKHPFGYGRIEYLTSLVIAVLILVSGGEMLINAVKLVFSPEELQISYISLAVVGFSAVIKYLLGAYTISMGKKASSSALQAVGMDCRNDSFISLITIASALVFFFFHFSVDAYVGIFTSFLILKAGASVLKDTISELLGRPGEKELAERLYQEIRGTKGILNAVDMMLHNYGPDAYSGSVNVEIDHNMSIGDAYQFLHELQLRIMQEYHVTMVFGIYAVDNDKEESRVIRSRIASFIRQKDHVKSYHAVYFDRKDQKIYCDLIVDYALNDWDGLKEEFISYMASFYPDQEIILTIETEFV